MKHLFFLIAILAVCGACSKPKLYGTIQEADEIVKNYQVPPEEAFRAAKEALAFRGYSIKNVDETAMTIETYWQPSTADSHYVEVFGRRDYGTVGSYYRLMVKVTPRANGSSVAITNVAKSFISNLKSTQQAEEQVFEKINDFTRKRDIQVTNIGVQ
jgi:hypothetical protein